MEISPENIPLWMQLAIGAAGCFLTLGLGIASYYRKLVGGERGEHIVLEQAALADMRPVREALKSLDRIAKAVEDIRDIMQAEAEAAEVERKVRERLDDEVERRVRERLQHRPRSPHGGT